MVYADIARVAMAVTDMAVTTEDQMYWLEINPTTMDSPSVNRTSPSQVMSVFEE